MVLAVVVAVVTLVLIGAHEAESQLSPPPTSQAGQMPPTILPNALFARLTRDIQAKNETGFLGLAAPAARQAIRSWWANQKAIGFTTGAIVPASADGAVKVDGSGNGTLTVLAGTHNRFDPTGSDGLPSVPCEEYRVGLHFSSPAATGEITSWRPLGHAPWDQGVHLYVRRAAHVVVAGDQADRALVNQTLPMAETAANYDIRLLDSINPKDLHQSGFIVFVSGKASLRDTWFRSGPQPKGWMGDAFGGITFPLAGPGVAQAGMTSKVSDDLVGGARVVMVPYQQANETVHSETGVLVHEFIHDILYPDTTGFYSSSNPVPAWADEGIAVAVQSLYLQNADPTPAQWNFGVLTNNLLALPSKYRTGHLPSTRQIYHESLALGFDWYQVAGSVYEYIAAKYGMNQMFAAAVLLTTNNTTPFGNVLQSSKGGRLVFYPPATIKSGWRAWLAGI